MSTVITNENAADFYAQKLGLADTSTESEVTTEETPVEPEAEPIDQSEPEQAEGEAKAVEDGKTKPKLAKRFSEVTSQRDKAREEARLEREAREAAEAKLKEYEAKATPQPTSNDEFVEPQPSQFDDAFEYAKALAEYSAEKALRDRDRQDAERRANEERNKTLKTWAERIEKAKAELPDYEDMIASSEIGVSDAVRDAIIESEVGPKILYHLAENPDLAKSLAEMSQAKALREIGKLEGRFEDAIRKPGTSVAATKSNAPSPISPIRATSMSTEVKIDSNGEYHGSYAAWKAARKAGKIR